MKNQKRKIGFHLPEDDPNESELKPDDGSLKEYIHMLYREDGTVEEKDFKTASEIAYELDEFIAIGTSTVAKRMTEMGFKTQMIEGKICFVVYSHRVGDNIELPY